MHPFQTGIEELLQISWAFKKPQQTQHQRRSHLTLSLAKPCWHPKHRNSLKMAWNNPMQQRASERDDSETWGDIVTECSVISREILVLWHCTAAGEYLIIFCTVLHFEVQAWFKLNLVFHTCILLHLPPNRTTNSPTNPYFKQDLCRNKVVPNPI